MLFPHNLKDSVTIFQKCFLIHRFICNCNICYIGCISKWVEIRMNQHILLRIQTHISDYTVATSSRNSTSAIASHLLDYPVCTCAYSPTMFPILEISTNELSLSILEALLIMKHKRELYIQKQFYTPPTIRRKHYYLCQLF